MVFFVGRFLRTDAISLIVILSVQIVSFLHDSVFLFIFKINLFIYLFLFLAVLGHLCCAWAFSSCGEWGLFFVAGCGLLIVVASLVAEHGL